MLGNLIDDGAPMILERLNMLISCGVVGVVGLAAIHGLGISPRNPGLVTISTLAAMWLSSWLSKRFDDYGHQPTI